MNEETRRKIEHTADAIREDLDYHHNSELADFIDRIGGTLIMTSALDILEDAALIKTGEHSFLMKVREDQTNERITFTIAHALGHLFLHCGYRYVLEMWEALPVNEILLPNASNEQELQAHAFAKALLMPEDLFKFYIHTHEKDGFINMRDVAKHFHVSYDTAKYRAKELDLIASAIL